MQLSCVNPQCLQDAISLQTAQARIECTLVIEDEEPGVTCRQTLEGEIEFKLLGLGRLAERIVVDNLEKTYQSLPVVAQRYSISIPVIVSFSLVKDMRSTDAEVHYLL